MTTRTTLPRTKVIFDNPQNVQPAPSVVYVDDSWAEIALGVDPDGAGLATAIGVDAFATIQDGVNAVTAYTGTNPRVVHVFNGAYNESNIAVTKAMTIDGESRAGVVLAPAAEDDNLDDSFAGTVQYGFMVSASGVTIQDLTVDGQANPGLTTGKNNYRAGIMTPDDGVDLSNLTFSNLAIQNIYRRGIQLNWSGDNNVIQDNLILMNDGTLSSGAYGIAVFGGMAPATQPTKILRNTIKNTAGEAISANFGALLTVQGNHISNSPIGMNLAALSDGSLIGGPEAGDGNDIDLTGQSTADIGILLTFSGDSPLDPGAVTVQGNTVTASGGDTGIYVFRTGVAPVVLAGNTLTATGSTASADGQGVGIFISDEDDLLGESSTDNGANVQILANVVSGFARGIDVLKSDTEGAAETLTVTIGNTTADANTISGASVAGISLRNTAGAAYGGIDATVKNNTASFSGNAIGIDVDGASATISGNKLYDNDVAIRFTNGGTGSVTGNDFDPPSLKNDIDLQLTASAGTVTVGAGNLFDATTYFIDNQDGQDIDLTAYTAANFGGLDPTTLAGSFRIEDKMHHRMDTDLPLLTTGLITWNAGKRLRDQARVWLHRLQHPARH